MKCEICGSMQGTITELVVIDSLAAMVEEGSITQGYPRWCEGCHKSVKVLVEDMKVWFQKRKEQLRQ